MMNTRSMRYSAFILTCTNIVAQLLGFAYRILLSRLIGPEGMGLFQLIFPFYSVAMAVASSGLCVAVSRISAEYFALKNYRALRLLIRRATLLFFLIFALLSVGTFLFANVIAEKFLGDERLLLAVYALVPCMLFTGLENLHKHFFYGTGHVNPPAVSDLLENIIRMSSVLLLLYLLLPQPDEYMLLIIVTGMCICEVFSSSFLRVLYKRRLRKLPGTGHAEEGMTKKIGKIAVPVSLSNLINNLISALIIILIPKRLVVAGYTSHEALSLFGTLFGMTMPLLSLPAALIVGLSLVMVPKLSENLALNDYGDVRRKISKALTVTSIIELPAIAIMIPLGPALGRLLFRHEIGGEYLLPLAIGTAFAIYMMILGQILNGLGKQTVAAVSFIIGNAVELAFTYFATSIPGVGLYGYIIGFIVSTIITAAINLFVVARTCGLEIEWGKWFLHPLLSALLCGLSARLIFLYAGKSMPEAAALFLALAGGGAIYLLSLAFQGIDVHSAFRAHGRRPGAAPKSRTRA